MTPLSDSTREHVDVLFSSAERAEAERLLVEECGDELLQFQGPTPTLLERVRFAALRISDGELSQLRVAIQLGQTDWRDLLVAADFADDIHAHERWKPRAPKPLARR